MKAGASRAGDSFWQEEDDNKGKRLMEKMGWNQGKGLGKSEQGSTGHMKVKQKVHAAHWFASIYFLAYIIPNFFFLQNPKITICQRNNEGIGASAATADDMFRASQSMFNDVLARLNNSASCF